MIRDYSSKTADEWFALKKWTGFLMQLPIGRPVMKECESARDLLAIRAVAANLSTSQDCGLRFSVRTEAENEKIIIVEVTKK